MYPIDLNYMADKTVELCRIPSPTGYTEAAIEWMENEFAALGVQTYRTRKGALVATLPGTETERTRLLTAHVDTLGAMVKEIKASGRLKLTRIGGYPFNMIEGEYVTIHTASGKRYTGTVLLTKASVHVHPVDSYKLEREESTMEVRIDERVSSKADVEGLSIGVGDFVSLDPRSTRTPAGFIKSRHLDDKACVAILLGIAKAIEEGGIQLAYTTHLLISNYEETGHGASAGIPTTATEVIAVDMAAVGEGQTSDEYSATVCMKDSTGPYDYELSRRLQSIAESEGITCRMDIYPSYGSDASAALRAGGEFKAACMGPGIDASHSYERCHEESLTATANLLLAYLTR
jgi:putative aminopeptidase FrvX